MVGAAVLAPWVLAWVELGLLGRARSSRRLGRDVGLGGGLEGGRLCVLVVIGCGVLVFVGVCVSGSPLCFITVYWLGAQVFHRRGFPPLNTRSCELPVQSRTQESRVSAARKGLCTVRDHADHILQPTPKGYSSGSE